MNKTNKNKKVIIPLAQREREENQCELESIRFSGEGTSLNTNHTLTQIAKFVDLLSNFTLSHWERGKSALLNFTSAFTSTCHAELDSASINQVPNQVQDGRKLRFRYFLAAFTFAELMVSLVIIAIITALLYPTIAEISPNNNKQLFKSAYKTVELTIQDIIENNAEINDSEKLCNEFKNRLNTVSFTNDQNDANESGCTNASARQIQTSNGMRWYFQNHADDKHTIYVDVNAANNGNSYASMPCDDCSGVTADPNNFCNGNSSNVWKTGCFRSNNQTVRDTFKIEIQDNGKIIMDNDTVGAKHLRDET